MIISHKYKIIFIKIMKIAGSSFEMAFTKYCGADDIITPVAAKKNAEKRKRVGYNKGQNYISPYEYKLQHKKIVSMFPSKFCEHYGASTIKKCLPKEIWDYYLKISIIRCPYDMLISYYYWAYRFPHRRLDNFASYAQNKGIDQVINNYGKLHIKRKLATDTLLRYEHLDEDIKKLETDIGCDGLSETFKNIHAKSDFRPQAKHASVAEVYSEHPSIKAEFDQSLDKNSRQYELLHIYVPSYKTKLEATLSRINDAKKIT